MERALRDKEFLLACHAARYFSLPKVQEKMPCLALKDAKYVEWLLDNPEIFEELAFANTGGSSTLGILQTIWLKENGKLEGTYLNLAVGAALSVVAATEEELLAKYDFYKQSHADGQLFSQFETLKPWEISIILKSVYGIGDVEDLAWGQQYLTQKRGIKANNAGNATCGLIPYRSKNKDGVSVHAGMAFYDNKPLSLKIYVEYGGVCGAVSKGASGFCRAKGIPAYPIGQPGHCAFIWKKPGNHWVIGNNVCGGWNWAQGGSPLPLWPGSAATIQALDHYLSMDKASESNNAYYCATLVENPVNSGQLLDYALKQNRKNYPAWQLRLTRMGKKRENRLDQTLAVAKELNAAFAEEPAVLEYLINNHLAPNAKNLSRSQLSALMLNRGESGESSDIYLRNLWSQAVKNIPELADMKIKYDHRTSGSLLNKWYEFYQTTKIKSRTRIQTCAFLEQSITSLGEMERHKTHGEMIGFYLKLLTDWKENQGLLSKTSEFVENNLKSINDPDILKSMLDFGIKVEMLRNEKGKIKKYQERLDGIKTA